MKAIFLDMNGALVDGCTTPHDPLRKVLRHGAGAALRMLAQLDYRLFVIGTLDGAASMPPEDTTMTSVERRLDDLLFREQLVLDGFYYCVHRGDRMPASAKEVCTCRKPEPGLLLRAATEHDINLPASWMIGSMLHDIELGNRAGCRTLLIDIGNEIEWRLGPRRVPTRIAPDLYNAAVQIARESNAGF